jgi:hypothetical protein
MEAAMSEMLQTLILLSLPPVTSHVLDGSQESTKITLFKISQCYKLQNKKKKALAIRVQD